jgi:hypothetical protein
MLPEPPSGANDIASMSEKMSADWLGGWHSAGDIKKNALTTTCVFALTTPVIGVI